VVEQVVEHGGDGAAAHGVNEWPWSKTRERHRSEDLPLHNEEERPPPGCGVRETLADMGQTIAENFGGAIPHGKSFLAELS